VEQLKRLNSALSKMVSVRDEAKAQEAVDEIAYVSVQRFSALRVDWSCLRLFTSSWRGST